MRKFIPIVLVCLVALLTLWPKGGDDARITASKSRSDSPTASPLPKPIRAKGGAGSSIAHRDNEPEYWPENRSKRVVAFSSRERRPDETDTRYQLRISWLDHFVSFEERAQLTPEQREQLIAVLADAQQQAILGWNERTAAIRDPRRRRDDYEGVPTLVSLDNSMRLEILPKLREFLNHKQMVSFRRTSGLTDPFGTAFTKPLDISFEPLPGR